MNWLKNKVSQVVGKVTDMAHENIVVSKIAEIKEVFDGIATNDSLSEEMKVRWIIRGGSLFCGLVAIQPLPFADVFLLTPIQVTMIYYLAKSMNVPMSENGAKEIVVYIAGVMGFGLIAQHSVLGLYKAGLPFLGGVTTVPLVFAATYGMGIAAQTVIKARQADRVLSDAEVKSIYQQAAERIKDEVRATTINEFKTEYEQLKKAAKQKDGFIAEQKRIIAELNEELANSLQTNQKMEIKLYDYEKKLQDKEEQINYIAQNMRRIQCQVSGGDTKGNKELQQQYNVMKLEKEKLEQTAANLKREIQAIEQQHEQELRKWIKSAENGSAEIFRNEQIRDRFIKLLQESQQEILIVSPWITEKVIKQLKNQMETALQRGVKINIIYGIDDNSNNGNKKDISDFMAQSLKRDWFKSYVRQGLFDIRRGNTHEKVVCCDGKKCLLGSYNYLSFGGRYDAKTRSEAAVLISESGTVKKYCGEFHNAFKLAKVID